MTDPKGRSISGLKASDFRIAEDGIAQTIAVLREGGGPPSKAELEASNKPRFVLKVRENDEEKAYVARYTPDVSNRNPAYRELTIRVLRPEAKTLTVRHAPGYWHDAPEE